MSDPAAPQTVPDLVARARAEMAPGGNPAAAARALTEALRQAPRDLGLMLFLGDAHHAAGQMQEAGRVYGLGLRLAAKVQPASLTPGIRDALRRAEARRSEYAAAYERFLRGRLPASEKSGRFDQAVDILLGRRQVYLQQPTKFYFPGLPQIQFYDPQQFAWAAELGSKTDVIRRELKAVMTEAQAFSPYLPANDDGRPHLRSVPLQGSLDWAAYYIWKDGALVEENARRCPETAAAVAGLPLDHLPGQAPSVLFSRLEPGAHIPPHCGLINTRLICHLPLIVPGPAWLRVGNEVHHWQEGRLVMFDDSIEHEAKNEADQTRVVLLFDVWRPEITPEEREQIAALIGAISDFTGEAIARER